MKTCMKNVLTLAHSRLAHISIWAMAILLVADGTLSYAASKPGASAQATETVIYTFGTGSDAGVPVGGLIHGPNGTFYGSSGSGGIDAQGVIYQLIPPASQGGTWTDKVLYEFQGGNDGAHPYAPIIRDSAGNLYGVTYYGGGYYDAGTVFELSPAKDGSWTEKVLYSFQTSGPNDGCFPNGQLSFGAGGELYGTTVYCGTGGYGTVFELLPPSQGSTTWTEKVLYSFTGGLDGGEPFAGLTRNGSGVLYSTTETGGSFGLGTVFSLTESNGIWSEAVLHSFAGPGGDGSSPESSLYLDAKGNLFGITPTGMGTTKVCVPSGCGMAFELSPDGSGGWTETVLHVFRSNGDGSFPQGKIISNGKGTFWGTTSAGGNVACDPTDFGCGTVYKLSNTNGKWTESILHTFQGGSDGAAPYSGVVLLNGKLYGTTDIGGEFSAGVAFQIQ